MGFPAPMSARLFSRSTVDRACRGKGRAGRPPWPMASEEQRQQKGRPACKEFDSALVAGRLRSPARAAFWNPPESRALASCSCSSAVSCRCPVQASGIGYRGGHGVEGRGWFQAFVPKPNQAAFRSVLADGAQTARGTELRPPLLRVRHAAHKRHKR